MALTERELKRQAWQRLAAQRRRAGLLRGRVVALGLICFALLWGIVFAQMATGNDPVLSAKEKAGRTTASAARGHAAGDRREGAALKAKAREEEATVTEEPAAEAGPEAEILGPRLEEAEAGPEAVEAEPLVTSQS